ncbi:hypothetical protein SDJN03_08201, partial [Cucurbita argyrosperma subsp. sororia]
MVKLCSLCHDICQGVLWKSKYPPPWLGLPASTFNYLLTLNYPFIPTCSGRYLLQLRRHLYPSDGINSRLKRQARYATSPHVLHRRTFPIRQTPSTLTGQHFSQPPIPDPIRTARPADIDLVFRPA